MSKIHIIPSEFNKELELQLAYSIKAGFPSPAEDLIKHPEATFYGRVDGDSMIDAGINDGDIAIIDRSVEASDGDVIVAKLWPRLGYKRKKILLFHSFELLAKSLWCKGLWKALNVNY